MGKEAHIFMADSVQLYIFMLRSKEDDRKKHAYTHTNNFLSSRNKKKRITQNGTPRYYIAPQNFKSKDE
jgi:hypothetical protein